MEPYKIVLLIIAVVVVIALDFDLAWWLTGLLMFGVWQVLLILAIGIRENSRNRARKQASADPNQELTVGRSAGIAIGGVLLLILMVAVWSQFSNKDSPEPEPTTTPEAQLKIIYVTGSVVNIREGPSTGFPVVTKVKKGHKLVELLRDGDWVNIALEETIAKTAWIHASLVSAEPQAEKSP